MKHPSSVKEFGVHLRQLREARNLSQQELADLSELDRITITRVENAKIALTLDHLIGIAKGLEIPMSTLMGFELKKEKPVRKAQAKKQE